MNGYMEVMTIDLLSCDVFIIGYMPRLKFHVIDHLAQNGQDNASLPAVYKDGEWRGKSSANKSIFRQNDCNSSNYVAIF